MQNCIIDNTQLKYYDGCLGYEALVCPKCNIHYTGCSNKITEIRYGWSDFMYLIRIRETTENKLKEIARVEDLMAVKQKFDDLENLPLEEIHIKYFEFEREIEDLEGMEHLIEKYV